MSELMNIALGPIPKPKAEGSLLHSDTPNSLPPCLFYIVDVFGGHDGPHSLSKFLRDEFFPRIDSSRLLFSFKKLKLFVGEVVCLGVTNQAGSLIHILPGSGTCFEDYPSLPEGSPSIHWYHWYYSQVDQKFSQSCLVL